MSEPTTLRVEPWTPPLEYVPRVIIKLRRTAGPPLPRHQVLDGHLKSLGIPLAELCERFQLGPARRNYVEEDEKLDRLGKLVRQRFVEAPEYETYVELSCKETSSEIFEELIRVIQLRASSAVERVFIEAHPTPPPSPPPPPPPGFANQVYLQPAPVGIGAIGVWNIDASENYVGPIGTGIGLADLEEGWDVAHPQLPAMPPVLGKNRHGTTHGTRVMGLLAGQDDRCRGIAFGADLMAISLSQDDGRGGYSFSRAGAIKVAREKLKSGDVILLETQVDRGGKLVPAEADELVFNEIQTCTALGITVIEAAGNDTNNIDGVLTRGDSGAVIVTAASQGAGGWTSMRNTGSRIHCFAQGTQVTTIDPVHHSGQTSVIDQTSAATAIVAGAAVLLQSWATRNFGVPLTPQELRDELSDKTAGRNTPSATGDIGVMPNLIGIRDKLIAVGLG